MFCNAIGMGNVNFVAIFDGHFSPKDHSETFHYSQSSVSCIFCNISFSKLLLIASPTFVWGFLKMNEIRNEYKIL